MSGSRHWASALLYLAWFGPRVLLLVAADSLLVSFQALLLSGDWDSTLLVMAVLRASLETGEVWFAWWCYHRQARGSRSLDDLRSATLFLLLIPGLVIGVFSLGFDVLSLWSGDWHGLSLLQRWTALWVSRALGVMTLTPFLLSVLTPLLVQRGLVSRDSSCDGDLCVFTDRLGWGDWLEMAGLALATCLVGAFAAAHVGRQGNGRLATLGRASFADCLGQSAARVARRHHRDRDGGSLYSG